MLTRPLPLLLACALFAGCAAFPELDGKPVAALRAADLRQPLAHEMPSPMQDFGDADLRQMIFEANVNGLDLAAARGRAMLADMTIAQARNTRLPQPAGNLSLTEAAATAALSVSFEPDLSGRIASAIRTAGIEHQAAGIDLLLARRILVREVTLGWVALGEAQRAAAFAQTRAEISRQLVPIVEARIAAGDVTGNALTEALQRAVAAQTSAAQTLGQIALAEARLRALGVLTIPKSVKLRDIALPDVPSKTNLGPAASRPEVCQAFLNFKAADSARASALLESRPRLVLTGSLTQTAKSLSGLLSGNLAPLASSVSLEGALLDGGQSRNRVDQARIAGAQAEIAWLQAQSRAEIAILEAALELSGANAALTAAREGYLAAETELARAKARKAAGESDLSSLIDAELAVLDAQMAVDTSRAATVRAAATWHDSYAAEYKKCTI
jgi:multidrug efflux system outer membrane protein